ncbi:MAG TPA: ATP synthase F1 subunit epsilon [Actinomycetota bacterium]|nr:ATP synthase F1 subunit epsilon [Actinomycetota bacterium]
MKVSIVTPEQEVWSGEADLVIGRSPEGDFGIMRGHIPFLAALVPGLVTVVSGGSRESFIVPGGFLEASGPADDYHVIVLADDAEEAGDIDAAEARRRIEEARRRSEDDRDDINTARLAASLAGPELGRD